MVTFSEAFECVCDEGFRLKRGRCKDINECKSSDPCVNASCKNKPGSYSCTCIENYQKSADSNVCFRSEPLKCKGKKNGGCSHFCAKDGCSCPKNWKLDVDGLTCVSIYLQNKSRPLKGLTS